MAIKDQEELLRYYNSELDYLRRMGGSFAARYPKVAEQLELSPEHCADPHVERLIESFAFLTARIQRQIDAEFPQITTALLGILYPHLVNPIPPMAVARFEVDPNQGKLTTGFTVPRQTPLVARTREGLTCRFRTCYPVTLWPFEVEHAAIESPDQFDLGDRAGRIAAVLRIRLVPRGVTLPEMELRSLRFHLRGSPAVANGLYELLFSDAESVALLPSTGAKPRILPDDSIAPVGFQPDEEVIPYPVHAHPAYRLLQEYFLFPQKFHFFDVLNLDRRPAADKLDILVLLKRTPAQRLSINRDTFSLGCTPIINLFPKTTEPIRLDHTQLEYRLVPDVRRERTTEVHSILSVSVSSNPMEESARIDPFFSFQHRQNGKMHRSFWNARRMETGREDMPGTDVYLSFLDLDFNPAMPPSQVAYGHTLCTNRDLAVQLPAGAELQIESSAPLHWISCLEKPTSPAYPPLEGASLWALISNLSLNFLSLSNDQVSLDALREILRVYSFSDAPATHKQVQGIRRMQSRRVVRRVSHDDWRGFCQGTEITLEFDEDLYAGSGAFLLGAVLQQFFALYASINSFTQLVMVRSSRREGEWKRWRPLAGCQPVV